MAAIIPGIDADSNGRIQFQYTAAPTHCSGLRLSILLDGKDAKTQAGWLSPGQSQTVTLSAAPGTHVVTLLPTGRIGGCNFGYIGNWGGTITTTCKTGP